jgi:hypothetical protein
MGKDTDVWRKGADGERRVAQILEALRPTLGFSLIHDLLVDFNGTTSQIDHILIDQFGALVIETKCYGAALRGKSEDHYWTACYRDGNTRRLLNPLVQNAGHRHWLSKLLVQNQRELPERYIQSLIVFAHGETKDLELSGIDPLRVVTAKNLEDFVAARYDFQPNDGALGPEAQRDLWGFLIAADRSTDPETVARHSALVQRAKNGRRDRRASDQPRVKSAAELKWDARHAQKSAAELRWTEKQAAKAAARGEEKLAMAGLGVLAAIGVLLATLASCAR